MGLFSSSKSSSSSKTSNAQTFGASGQTLGQGAVIFNASNSAEKSPFNARSLITIGVTALVVDKLVKHFWKGGK